MIPTCEGQVLSINGKVIIRKANTLSFTVSGTKFPNFEFTTTSNGFWFRSLIAQKVIVNWGDGSSESIVMTYANGTYNVGWTQNGLQSTYVKNDFLRPVHEYVDGNIGDRVITFMFEDLSKLFSFSTSYVLLKGAFPIDLLRAEKLTILTVAYPLGMTNLPNLSQNKSLVDVSFTGYNLAGRFSKMPDSFFDINLKSFGGTSTFDLSDPISSNLFKLNQWSNLEKLDLENCNITEFDETFKECTKLVDLRLGGNPFTEFPDAIRYFPNLQFFYISVWGASNISFVDFSNNNKIINLLLGGDYNYTEIPIKFRGLLSLRSFIHTVPQIKFNQFVDAFYELCTVNGSIVENGSPIPYPNRFRNIAWGSASRTFNGAKVAPTGYVQGASNGTPINQGQKVYVLQNQYNHTITHG